nr:MAG TPA: hypothetical protein [Bacteriophage sp.]
MKCFYFCAPSHFARQAPFCQLNRPFRAACNVSGNPASQSGFLALHQILN